MEFGNLKICFYVINLNYDKRIKWLLVVFFLWRFIVKLEIRLMVLNVIFLMLVFGFE